jgi:hypothetical protein
MTVGPQRLWRGEVRLINPSPWHPDPAQSARTNPTGLLEHFMAPGLPDIPDWNRGSFSVGTHWTRSPEIIPERFTESVAANPQPGHPMQGRELNAVSRFHAQEADYATGSRGDWHEQEARRKKNDAYFQRAEREGVNIYHDLSGGDPDRPGRAKAFHAAVVWEGLHPGRGERGTNYEDETDLAPGSKIQVTGARIHIPPAGQTLGFEGRHPSTFTLGERREASMDVMHRSTYSHIGETSPLPWSRVQFPEPVELDVSDRFSRYGR